MLQQGERTQHSTSDDIMVERERQVADRIRERSSTFTIRQMASIHQMSIPYLRGFAERYGITFVGTDGSRSKRLSSAVISREREHTSIVVARSLTRKPITSLDLGKVSPEVQERGRRRCQEELNSFIQTIRDLSLTNTREQTSKKMGISPTFLRSIAYNQEIVFFGEANQTNQPATPAVIRRLQTTLFRPSKKTIKPATSRMIREFVISDIEDEV